MKKFITLSAFVAMAVVANAQTAQVVDDHAGHNHAVTTPVSQVALTETLGVKESEYDFGKIPQGKPVTHNFTVMNNGTTPFKLDNVQASCGCTTPEWDKELTLAPGQSTDIKVGYNAAAVGPFNKSITVTYNGTQQKVVFIKGDVWQTPSESAPSNTGLNAIKAN